MLLSKEATSVDLVTVYSERCYTIGRRLNLVTEEFYNEALDLARQRDREREEAIRNGTTHELGLLHGIPLSIKDHVLYKTLDI